MSRPVYIPSKGRALHATTPTALARLGVPYTLIVEDSEHDAYAARYGESCLLVLPKSYQDEYDTLDELGRSKPLGSGPPRNYAMDHALEAGHSWCWVIDDNILYFGYLRQNQRIPAGDGMVFAAMEDFCSRYTNIGEAGPEYWWFVKGRIPHKRPFLLNRRVQSCNLLRTDVGIRWRGRYNEDVILAIQYLKAGWCTVNFWAFLQFKARTQTMPGGLTDDIYKHDQGGGTLAKSQFLVERFPDVARVQKRFGRVHHWSDWSQFADMQLIRDPAWQPPAVNPYQLDVIDAGVTVRPRKGELNPL